MVLKVLEWWCTLKVLVSIYVHLGSSALVGLHKIDIPTLSGIHHLYQVLFISNVVSTSSFSYCFIHVSHFFLLLQRRERKIESFLVGFGFPFFL